MAELNARHILRGLAFLCLPLAGAWAQVSTDSVEVSLPAVMARAGDRVVVPVQIKGTLRREIVAGEVQVRYDPAILTLEEMVRRGGLIEDQRWLKADTVSVGGDYQAVFAAAVGFKEDGDLFHLTFRVAASAALGTITPLTLGRVGFNNGDVPIRLRGGSVRVVQEVIKANFSARPRRGQVPLEVQFLDHSSGAISGYLWDFGDGATSAQQAPLHAYVRPGSYTVSLTVTGAVGADVAVRPDYIQALPDTTAPEIISGPRAVEIKRDRATLLWITNERSDSYVEYAAREDLVGARTVSDTTLSHQHRIELRGLSPGIRYYYRVRSTDAAGNASGFRRGSFRTLDRPDTQPPVITRGPDAEEISDRSATVVWRTHEPGTSLVEYSTSADYSRSLRVEDRTLVEEHRVPLPGLSPATRYYYRVRSTDSENNTSEYKKGQFRTLAAPDADPPVFLFGPVVIGITHSSATVKWATDEPASGRVEYGTGTEYGLVDSSAERRHENLVRLTGLDSNTLYHFRVTATDAAGHQTTTPDLEFTTRSRPDDRPPCFAVRPSVLGRFADRLLVQWETDEPTSGQVEYGLTSKYGSAAAVAAEERVHTVVLAGLDAAAEYHFRVSATDLSGNGPVFSDDQKARTLDKTEESELRLLEQPSVTSRGHDRVTVTWRTSRPASSEVSFGLDATYGRRAGSAELAAFHEVILSGLKAATLYHAQVSSTDPAERTVRGTDFTFSTRAAPDTLSPIITRGPEVLGTTDSSAVIAWRTNEPADGRVEYGPDLNYGAVVELEEFVQEHRVNLTGLEPGRTYHFRVSSTDAAGNGPVASPDATFATQAQVDRRPPVLVAGPGIGNLQANRVTIQWRTDEPADSFVDFGTDKAYSTRAGDAALNRTHEVTLADLQPGTLYHYRVSSTDLAGNTSTTDPSGNARWSQDLLFRTLQQQDRQPPVITRGPVIVAGDREALISFTTDEPCVARLAYGTAATLGTPAEEVVYEEKATTVHELRLGHLKPGLRYVFRLTCQDAAGNILEVGAPKRAAKVAPASGALDLSGALEFSTETTADTQSPVITSGPAVVSRTTDAAIVEWTTDEPADSYVEFGLDGLQTLVGEAEYSLQHRLMLTGLEPGSAYTCWVRSADFAGNPPVYSPVLAFTTLDQPDLSPPALLGTPQLVYVGSTQAILQWRTDEAASAEVSYGEGQTLDRVLFGEAYLTEHQVSLTGLTPATTYSYQIRVTDPSRNGPTTTQVSSFATAGSLDTRAPAISQVQAGDISDKSAIVTWTTDEPASGFVSYGTSDSLGQGAGQSDLGTQHRVMLTNLIPGASYRFRVESIDPAGNRSALSALQSLQTGATADQVPPTAPADFRARVGLETAVLSWQPSWAPDLASYTLYRQSRTGVFAAVATGLADTFYVDASLVSGTPYTYYVTALDLTGNQSPSSAQAGGTPSVRNVPGAVAPLGAQTAGGTVTLQVANAQGTAPVTYTFQVSSSELFGDVVARASGVAPGRGSTSWTFEKQLAPGQEYWWRARASDGTFDGPWSFPSFFTATATASARNRGDFDGDNRVAFADFFRFVDGFGRRTGETGFDAMYDMSGNELIDFADFFLFVDVFGTVYSSSRQAAPTGGPAGAQTAEIAVESQLDEDGILVRVRAPRPEQWRGIGLALSYDPQVLALDRVEEEDGFLRGVPPAQRLFAHTEPAPGQVLLLAHRMGASPFQGPGSIVCLRFRALVRGAATAVQVAEGAVQAASGSVQPITPQVLQVRLAPAQYALQANYPNPFNPETAIGYDLPRSCRVRLAVYDGVGQRVRDLVDGDEEPGRYRVVWDGRDQQGRQVASGLYFYRLEAGDYGAVRKMMLLR